MFAKRLHKFAGDTAIGPANLFETKRPPSMAAADLNKGFLSLLRFLYSRDWPQVRFDAVVLD